jgi:Protein of unknown function (DUF2934)
MVAFAIKQAETPETSSATAEARPAQEEIVALAYALWQERGCPEGSPETDWFKCRARIARPAGMRERAVRR